MISPRRRKCKDSTGSTLPRDGNMVQTMLKVRNRMVLSHPKLPRNLLSTDRVVRRSPLRMATDRRRLQLLLLDFFPCEFHFRLSRFGLCPWLEDIVYSFYPFG